MKKIIAYGDSNTYGWDPRDFFGNPYDSPWPTVLEQEINDPDLQVINLGEPGSTVAFQIQHAEMVKRRLKSMEPFDGLILMLGTNDILNSARPHAGSICRDMDAFLGLLRTWYPQLPILLLAPPQIAINDRTAECLRQVCQELAASYQKLAITYHAEYFDTASLHLPLAFDGIHLTEEAHYMLGRTLGRLKA